MSNITTNQITLPKGGGAIQGIDEKFHHNEHTGTFSLSIPIDTPPCRDFSPQLRIEYSSGSGNGIFGLGFGLSVPHISRKTSTGLPRYDETDTFLLAGAEDLVPVPDSERHVTANGSTYSISVFRPRIDTAYDKIERWTEQQTGESHWRIVSKEQITSIFGKTQQARIVNPDKPWLIFQWLLEEAYDSHGNHMSYEYESESNNVFSTSLCEQNRTQSTSRYLHRISYGNTTPFQVGQDGPDSYHFEVVFDYGQYNLAPGNTTPYTPLTDIPLEAYRKDSFSTYQSGFEVRTHRLCRSILLFHRFDELGTKPILGRSYRFYYDESPAVSLLTSVETTGHRYENGRYQTKSLPPLQFGYTPFQPDGQPFTPLAAENHVPLPSLGNQTATQLVDLYGEGIPGILYQDAVSRLYLERVYTEPAQQGRDTVRYGSPEELPVYPLVGNLPENSQQLMDITGTGQLALVVGTRDYAGFFEVNPDRTWKPYQPFAAFTNDFYDADHYLVDVTGDGLADLLWIEDERVVYYPSRGKDGFGAPVSLPRTNDVPLPRRGAENEVLKFADLFGTGMQHLVRITNGRVECWPHLGYGRFGKPVLMENAPRFHEELDGSRLFLGDLDGSGTADLIYAYSDRVEVFFNQSGNSFTDPLVVPLPRAFDRINQLELADVFGNGTSCLLASEDHPQPQHWCCDFTRQKKPYLLNEITNNLGAQTVISYCSSTQFYLRDKQQGAPWVVRLPIPVQVVETIEQLDLISQTRLVSSYSYHHGYYDGVEREFRGFGRVERQDAETLFADAKPTDVPPVLTKTWYHTGAWLQAGSLSRQYRQEYFQGDPDAYELPDSVFDWSAYKQEHLQYEPDADAWREAYRALKGMVLRQEVYAPTAEAASPEQHRDAPYTAVDTYYLVRMQQAGREGNYGVYDLHPQETLTYHYERNPHDPRCTHSFLLEVDDYGNALRTCSVDYGRRAGEQTHPEQLGAKVTYTEAHVLNVTGEDMQLLGVPIETKQYEIKNLRLPENQLYFTLADVQAGLQGVVDSEQTPLLGWERHYYWNPATQKADPLGQVAEQHLLCRTETAVLRNDQAVRQFADALNESQLTGLLQADGGYRQDGDYWWNPGLAQAYGDAEHFYVVKGTNDPFGNTTVYDYDPHQMMIVSVTDAHNNKTTVKKLDYQTLQPQQLEDWNGNSSEVLFDPLGMVIATTYYGTEGGQAVGFSPMDRYVPQEQPSMEKLLGDPATRQACLQGAASYFAYDLLSWMNNRQPVCSVTLIAEDYPSTAAQQPPIHVQLVYSDGFGRKQQKLVQVEPGEAFGPDGKLVPGIVTDRWLVSGRTVYNNKGKPFKQYEPYYLSTYRYIDNPVLATFGVSSTLTYDPLGRVVRVDTAKGFFTQVEFTPWTEAHYDENDTIKDSLYYKQNIDNLSPQFQAERQVLQKASLFFNTPLQKVLDQAGRTIVEIQQNEGIASFDAFVGIGLTQSQSQALFAELQTKGFLDFRGALTTSFLPDQPGFSLGLSAAFAAYEQQIIARLSEIQSAKTLLCTRYEWDIQGNQFASTDPRLADTGRRSFTMSYDLAGSMLRKTSADAGTHWQLADCLGNVIFSRDSRQFVIRHSYDALHRRIATTVAGGDGTDVTEYVSERIIYGDSPNDQSLLPAEPEAFNLRGKIYMQFDQAGLVTNNAYSISDQLLSTNRQLAQNYRQTVDWRSVTADVRTSMLQPTVYETTYRYDALGRTTSITNADGTTQSYGFHQSGLLNELHIRTKDSVQPELYVQGIDYNARGQRTRIRYGNNVTTTYDYEPTTFRLTRIATRRESDGKTLQQLIYTYDPVGNITFMTDTALPVVFANQQQVKPESDYTYDALYRLIQGTGREHPALSGQPKPSGDASSFIPLPPTQINDQQQLQNYTRRYFYDAAGNLVQTKHLAANSGTSWTRRLSVSDSSNRAVEAELLHPDDWQPVVPADQIDRFFDPNGNATQLVGLGAIRWNAHNNLASATVIARDNAPSDCEYYVYDSTGTRVRKVTERYANGGTVPRIEETIYLETLEIKRITQGSSLVEERHTERVMDDQHCIANRLVWTQGTPPDGVSNPQIRFQLDNHLGSAVLELDVEGQIISFEEYYPFGGTALIAGRSMCEVKLKQYRYAGKERDSLTGFYYYGARYYAPWLGRWTSPDPAGAVDGLNLFVFARNNPIGLVDHGGYVASKNKKLQTKKSKKKKFGVIKSKNMIYKFEGRPDFDSAAKKIKLKKNQDRRHVIGYDDMIRPNYERIANEIIKNQGEAKFIKWQMKIYQKYKIKRAPKESASAEKHMTFGLTKLNSTKGNLNPEAAHENQAIEHVRQQAIRVEESLTNAFATNTPTIQEIKTLMKQGFALSNSGTDITNFADNIRRFVHNRIDQTQDSVELIRILHETKVSTGVDLNKAEGSKQQTAFALNYIEQVGKATDSDSTMSDKEKLKTVWSLYEM